MQEESADRGRTSILDQRTRKILTSVAVCGMMLLAVYGFGFIIVQTIWPGDPAENWLISVLERQYAALLGVPLSAASAVCVVLLLETVSGPIEIETSWLTFRGAAAPVVLWILCFLAMTFALGWLWV